jgi:hypothetical protein
MATMSVETTGSLERWTVRAATGSAAARNDTAFTPGSPPGARVVYGSSPHPVFAGRRPKLPSCLSRGGRSPLRATSPSSTRRSALSKFTRLSWVSEPVIPPSRIRRWSLYRPAKMHRRARAWCSRCAVRANRYPGQARAKGCKPARAILRIRLTCLCTAIASSIGKESTLALLLLGRRSGSRARCCLERRAICA